jgi:hypothetical protein
MRELRLTYTLTEADVLEGRRHAKTPVVQDSPRSFLFLLALITLLYATPAVWDFFNPPPAPSTLARQVVLGLAPWVYVITWFLLLAKMGHRDQARLSWKISPLYRLEHTACLNDDGVAIQTSASSSRYAWSVFIGFNESPNLLLLITSGGSFFMIPKRALPADANLDTLRQELGTRINSLCLPPGEVTPLSEPAAPTLLPRLHFTLSAAEYAKARGADVRMKWLGFGLDALVLLPVYAGFFWLVMSTGLLSGRSPLWLWIPVFVLLVLVQLVMQYVHWRRARYLHGPQFVDVTETGLLFQSAAGTQWIGWGAITRYRRTQRVFVIFLRDGTLRCIPERAIPTKKDEDAFERHLQARIMRTPGFPVVLDSNKS